MEVFEIEKQSSRGAGNGVSNGGAYANGAGVSTPANDGLQDHNKAYKGFSKAQRHNELRKEIAFVEHLWPVEKLFGHFVTHPLTGLSQAQVLKNRGLYGENRLTPGKTTPAWVKYLMQYTNFFSILLIVASILCFVAYGIDKYHEKENLYVGIVLMLVVVVTATFTYWQEAKTEHIMEGFKKMIPAKAHTVREGNTLLLDTWELVPGDLVELVEGDRTPADVRIIQARDFFVDNSAITGESEPVERGPDVGKDAAGQPLGQPLEAQNLCFYTTIVTGGSAKGIVIGTGDNTVMGQIAGLATETQQGKTPLGRELDQFVFSISMLAIAMGLFFFCVGLLLGDPFIQTIVFAIGVIVANVPEGLMAAVTVSLALASQRMHRKHVLVKNLQSVETLGSCTVIASDKTGTLTQNCMTVQHCWYDLGIFTVPGVRNRVEWEAVMRATAGAQSPAGGAAGVHVYEPQSPTFQKLQLIATLCNNANFIAPNMDLQIELRRPDFDLNALPCTGDASEQGLLKFVEPIRSAKEVRDLYTKLFEIKFTSFNKWQLSIHMQSAAGRLPPVLVMKGAPERVLERCSHILVNGQVYDLNRESRERFQEAYEHMGGLGERVLGLAYRDLEGFANDFKFSNKPEPNFPTDQLVFVGLVSLMDPPRPGVLEAVAKCRKASIKVFMVTGDHPITATAIAKQVGILDVAKLEDRSALVVTGDQIREIMDLPNEAQQTNRWNEILAHDQLVFARVSPQHKLLIVENCQRRGEIVAVTGDGVNDAPALKRGDVGIAMGISGKDVSKEASDMILMDDNFASIVNGVEEGRLIFDNLKKTICYAITVNIPQLIPFLLQVLIELPLPLSPVLMLAICLGTDMMPAIALAYEEPESDIMDRPPRSGKTDRLVSWKLVSHAYLLIGVVQALAGLLAYLLVLNDFGYMPYLLARMGPEWEEAPMICTLNEKAEPSVCGYGCDFPNYSLGQPESATPNPDLGPYSYYGSWLPAPATPASLVDPFSEFGPAGFKGTDFCNINCTTPGISPALCPAGSNNGFPGRAAAGSPAAPGGGVYWWGGVRQYMPNVPYQVNVLRYAQTAYFVACVVTQWANLIVVKTRRNSVFQQGMSNWMLNFALVFETAVALALVYIPFLNEVFSTRPLAPIYWLCGVPFALTILLVGELRKFFIRKYPGKWMERWTFW